MECTFDKRYFRLSAYQADGLELTKSCLFTTLPMLVNIQHQLLKNKTHQLNFVVIPRYRGDCGIGNYISGLVQLENGFLDLPKHMLYMTLVEFYEEYLVNIPFNEQVLLLFHMKTWGDLLRFIDEMMIVPKLGIAEAFLAEYNRNHIKTT
jgi:hypothetical protein